MLCNALHADYIFLFPRKFSYARVRCPKDFEYVPLRNRNNPIDFKT